MNADDLADLIKADFARPASAWHNQYEPITGAFGERGIERFYAACGLRRPGVLDRIYTRWCKKGTWP